MCSTFVKKERGSIFQPRGQEKSQFKGANDPDPSQYSFLRGGTTIKESSESDVNEISIHEVLVYQYIGAIYFVVLPYNPFSSQAADMAVYAMFSRQRRRRKRTGLLLQGFAVCLVLKVELAAHKDSCVMPSSCLLFSFIQHLRIYLGTVLPKTLSKLEFSISRCPNDKILKRFIYLCSFFIHQQLILNSVLAMAAV